MSFITYQHKSTCAASLKRVCVCGVGVGELQPTTPNSPLALLLLKGTGWWSTTHRPIGNKSLWFSGGVGIMQHFPAQPWPRRWAPPPLLDSLAPSHSPQEIGWKRTAALSKAERAAQSPAWPLWATTGANKSATGDSLIPLPGFKWERDTLQASAGWTREISDLVLNSAANACRTAAR